MEKIELLKSIRLTLDYCDENGVESKKDFTVKVNTPTLRDKSESIMYKKPTVYTLSFSLTLPDHIHSHLLGKTVAAGGLSRKADNLLTLNQILEEFGVSKITIEVAKNLGMSELSTFDELHLIAVDYLVDTQSKDVYQPSI